MKSIHEISRTDLTDWLVKEGGKPFLVDVIYSWIYEKCHLDFMQMSNIPLSLRQKLADTFTIISLEKISETDSTDVETTKFLFKLHEGSFVESVLIRSFDRRTVCVSSQVGCPAKCAFCASGKGGFKRNLRPHEILEQILLINHYLMSKGERVCHIVYMGMGEPFKNYDAVVSSIRMIIDPKRLGISPRRITVSTVGVVEGIRRFTEEEIKVNLVLSLHAPNQKIREKIIPYARKYPLEEILEAMEAYREASKRDITFEYTLIEGINDSPDHAFELSHLLKGKQCTVNLIPYNPIDGIRLYRPTGKAIKAFRSVLYGCGIVNTCRYTKGNDIAAACGQLRLIEEEKAQAAIGIAS